MLSSEEANNDDMKTMAIWRRNQCETGSKSNEFEPKTSVAVHEMPCLHPKAQNVLVQSSNSTCGNCCAHDTEVDKTQRSWECLLCLQEGRKI